jgi:anti-sigma B factor antagonist
MKIEQNIFNGITVLSLDGRLDAQAAPKAKNAFEESCGMNSRIVIDMTHVDFMDSSGLGALVSSARNLRLNGGDMKLVGPGQKVRLVFEMTRTLNLFDIYDSSDAAVQSCRDEIHHEPRLHSDIAS